MISDGIECHLQATARSDEFLFGGAAVGGYGSGIENVSGLDYSDSKVHTTYLQKARSIP